MSSALHKSEVEFETSSASRIPKHIKTYHRDSRIDSITTALKVEFADGRQKAKSATGELYEDMKGAQGVSWGAIECRWNQAPRGVSRTRTNIGRETGARPPTVACDMAGQVGTGHKR